MKKILLLSFLLAPPTSLLAMEQPSKQSAPEYAIRNLNLLTDTPALKAILPELDEVLSADEKFNFIFSGNSSSFCTSVICEPQGHEVVGFIQTNVSATNSDYISWIAINKHYQSRGLGKKLIEFAERSALQRNKKTLELQCEKQKTRAISFYEHLGFKKDNNEYGWFYTMTKPVKKN